MVVVFGILMGQSSYAALPDINTFKCTMAPAEGNKLVIFALSSSQESIPFPVGYPMVIDANPIDGEMFCVEVLKSADTATWDQLLRGANFVRTNLLNSGWHDDDVIKQVYLKDTNTWWKAEHHLVDDDDPGKVNYKLTRFSSERRYAENGDVQTNSGENLRLRYRFHDLSPDFPDQYLYFMKEVLDPQQYGGATAACALHNSDLDNCEKDTVNKCVFAGSDSNCYAGNDARVCGKFIEKECNTTTACNWKESKCQAKDSATISNEAVKQFIFEGYGEPSGYNGPLVKCAFDGSCNSVEQLVEQAVKIADWLFSIIAGLAFMFFVYGGITMIMSFGNSEKVGKGKQILVAAAVGLIITFSAYILIGFVVKAIGINAGLTPFN